MSNILVYIILLINIVVAIRFLIRKKCEIPFFLALFNIMVEYRLISLELGYGKWVNYDYGISLKFNFELANIVSYLIVMGTTVMMYSFIYFYKPPKLKLNDSDEYLKRYTLSKKRYIIIGLVVFSVFQVTLSGALSSNFGFLAKVGNNSFIIMLFLITIFTDSKNRITKIFFYVVFLAMAYITYSPTLRFQFLGWMIPIAYYLTRNVKSSRKVSFLLIGILFTLVVFSAAGVLRSKKLNDLTISQLVSDSFQRMLIADDINFIDGFMMMYQIYPDYLDFDYGMEHVDIVLRPIPRGLWEDKPLAGWFQKYSAKYGTSKASVGFSPTVWGVFYAEMGVFGIVFFSVLWAWALAKIYSYFKSFSSSLWAILVGIMLAGMIPLFRSGDLAGDTFLIFLSYWAMIIFVRGYKKYVVKQLRIEFQRREALI
jgi:hypothetical protein